MECTIEKLASLIVRSRYGSSSCEFVEAKDKFGKIKQFIIYLLAETGDTPAKEQASKAADCAFAHIFQPTNNSLLYKVLHGEIVDVNLDEALAASLLEIFIEELRSFAVFSAESQSLVTSDSATQITSRWTSQSS